MKKLKRLILFYSLIWSESHYFVIVLSLQALVNSAQTVFNVVIVKYLIDEILEGAISPRLIAFASMTVGANLFFMLLKNVFTRTIGTNTLRMQESIKRLISEKAMRLPFYELENIKCLDLKEKAVFALDQQNLVARMIRIMSELLKQAVTVVSLTALVFTLSPALLSIILLSVAASVIINRLTLKHKRAYTEEMVPLNRRYAYYLDLVNNERIQKDIRLYDMSDILVNKVNSYNGYIYKFYKSYSSRQSKEDCVFTLISAIQTTVAFGYCALRALSDSFGPRISIGDFTMYTVGVINLYEAVTSICFGLQWLSHSLGLLEPFTDFMTLPDETSGGTVPFYGEIYGIRFDDVSFTYPGSDKPVLKNITIEIIKGQKVSIVGLNGAGKTTLIKLLCRMYSPDSGTIYVNDVDISEYEMNSYLNAIAAVFQDYKLFPFSIRENITCGNPGDIDAVIDDAGLKDLVAGLKSGIETGLVKIIDEEHAELSGGESQKIAIARALYKKASLIILDEPTSALDALAEAAIYEEFNRITNTRTAIYISHRMSSCIFCDRIIVLDGGVITDTGSHAELMKNEDGLYHKLFTMQARNYT